MPIYEYACELDGTVLELIRPMAQADAPVTDPEGKGRTFVRKHSTFSAGTSGSAGSSRSLPMSSGCCPCGKPGGKCGA
jgi:predicted nucleic acid-binding Zn ribbon protein